MFYIGYLVAELRRRPARTALTALGLAVGVGLVVMVGALSAGLDDAQSEVLEPLTGVGTDLSLSRPLAVSGERGPAVGPGGAFGQLSRREQRELQRENKNGLDFDLADLGDPGEDFAVDRVVATDLSFSDAEVPKIGNLRGAQDAAGGLTLNAVHIEGTVPQASTPGGAALHGGDFQVSSVTVSGVEVRKPDLGAVTPGQVTRGRYFSRDPATARKQVIVDLGYARQKGIGVGDTTKIAGRRFRVVGLSSAALGGESSNVYVELGRLQRLSDREGRVNAVQVRADSADAVRTLEDGIARQLPGAEVVTAADLADRVGGSLDDADNLSSKLGTALAVVALLAAFLIATLLTLSSVQKRIRELGTLKALGWRGRLVVRQVAGEALAQGALGGLLGAAIGVAGATIVDAIGPTLEASVKQQPGGGFDPFGQGAVGAGSTDVVLGAPIDIGLVVLAVGLAIAGGLLAGAAGGLRVARLRPAEALRSAE
ncbi:MAG: ABC transporter permease [Actinobacteria bacterium]|nr:ABC transporter permease [Actinomycetota bacterium]